MLLSMLLEGFFQCIFESFFRKGRRGSGVRITDSTETLGYAYGYSNMKKVAILDPHAQN